MIIYLYDGSFEGLLTAVYDGYYSTKKPDQILDINKYNRNLMDEENIIFPDIEKSSKVSVAIINKISEYVFSVILNGFLTEDYNVGTIIFNYLKYGFKVGKNSIDNLANSSVGDLVKLSTKVSREKHRMLGLIRFSELDNGILYCPIEPTYNILILLAPHFSERMNNEIWVIHDIKRRIGIFYDKRNWHISQLSYQNDFKISCEEIFFQDLWRKYFKSISIEEKENSKLQMQMMPKKYWKYLTEKQVKSTNNC